MGIWDGAVCLQLSSWGIDGLGQAWDEGENPEHVDLITAIDAKPTRAILCANEIILDTESLLRRYHCGFFKTSGNESLRSLCVLDCAAFFVVVVAVLDLDFGCDKEVTASRQQGFASSLRMYEKQ